MRRNLQKLKTGTVRIAFNSEQQHDYQLDLKIIPVGLTYSDPTAFRGKVFINVGAPFYVRDFRAAYEANPLEAVKMVTLELQEQVRALMIDTADDDEDLFIKQLEIILQNNQPVAPELEFKRTKKIIADLRAWKSADVINYTHFRQEVNDYFRILQQKKISDDAVASAPDKFIILKLFAILLGLPIFLYGFVNHFFPAFVPFLVAWFLVNRVKLYIGYTSTIKFALSLLTVPLFYWLQSELVESWFSTGVSWWYLLSLPVAGMLAWEWWKFAKKSWKWLNFVFLEEKQALKESRERIADGISNFF
jgi:hypothetical protein